MSFQTEPKRLGDLVADIASAAGIASAAATSGGIQQWLASRYQEFQRLPSDVQVLRAKMAVLRNVLSSTHPDVLALLDTAESDLGQLTSAYPGVAAQIQTLIANLAPALTGGGGISVLDQVVAGLGGVNVLHQMNELFSLRDQAADVVNRVVQSPVLSPTERAALTMQVNQTSTTLNTGTILKVGLLALGGWIGYKVLRKVI